MRPATEGQKSRMKELNIDFPEDITLEDARTILIDARNDFPEPPLRTFKDIDKSLLLTHGEGNRNMDR